MSVGDLSLISGNVGNCYNGEHCKRVKLYYEILFHSFHLHHNCFWVRLPAWLIDMLNDMRRLSWYGADESGLHDNDVSGLKFLIK